MQEQKSMVVDGAEVERGHVEVEIELAAGQVADDPRYTAADLAQSIHASHKGWAVAILEERISKRAAEFKMHRDAIAMRYRRDIDDRARLVLDDGQLIGDAAAAIAGAYPERDAGAILEELGEKVKAIRQAREDQVARTAVALTGTDAPGT